MSMTTRYLKRVATIKVLEQLSLQRNEDFQTAEDPFLSVSNYNLHKIFFKKKFRLSKMSGIFSALNGSTLYWMKHKRLKAVPGK